MRSPTERFNIEMSKSGKLSIENWISSHAIQNWRRKINVQRNQMTFTKTKTN